MSTHQNEIIDLTNDSDDDDDDIMILEQKTERKNDEQLHEPPNIASVEPQIAENDDEDCMIIGEVTVQPRQHRQVRSPQKVTQRWGSYLRSMPKIQPDVPRNPRKPHWSEESKQEEESGDEAKDDDGDAVSESASSSFPDVDPPSPEVPDDEPMETDTPEETADQNRPRPSNNVALDIESQPIPRHVRRLSANETLEDIMRNSDDEDFSSVPSDERSTSKAAPNLVSPRSLIGVSQKKKLAEEPTFSTPPKQICLRINETLQNVGIVVPESSRTSLHRSTATHQNVQHVPVEAPAGMDLPQNQCEVDVNPVIHQNTDQIVVETSTRVSFNTSGCEKTGPASGEVDLLTVLCARKSYDNGSNKSENEEKVPSASILAPQPSSSELPAQCQRTASQSLQTSVHPVNSDGSNSGNTGSTSGDEIVPAVQYSRRSPRADAKKLENKENAPEIPKPDPGPSSFEPPRRRNRGTTKPVKAPADIQFEPVDPVELDKNAKFFYLGRNPTIPTGLKRIPFNGQIPKQVKTNVGPEYPKMMRKIKVQKEENFPKMVGEGKLMKSVLFGRVKVRNAENTYPDDSSDNDPNAVAVLEEYRGAPGKEYMEMQDHEELVWSADKLNEHFEEDETKINNFYQSTEDEYLFAVWRQFESHVPLEYALQNLMKNGFNIPKALESIDQYLERLPQKMPIPSMAQVQNMASEIGNYGFDVELRYLQDNVMRNWHIGELHIYYYKFRKFFEPKEDGAPVELRIGCNCREVMCRQITYEPRYGCANCTNKLRKNKLPPGKLCLICATHLNLTGTARPANNTVFYEDDLKNIKIWDETVPEKSREEFETWLQDEKNKRYMKLRLTQEEVLMLDFERLTLNNELAEQVSAMLQPYVLPHFSLCQCRRGLPPANPPAEFPTL